MKNPKLGLVLMILGFIMILISAVEFLGELFRLPLEITPSFKWLGFVGILLIIMGINLSKRTR